MHVYRWLGDNLGRLNAIAWAWTLVPSAGAAAGISWWARVGALPLWARALIFLGTLALCSILLVAFRWNRTVDIAQATTKELEDRVYGETLAQLRGRSRAEQQHRQEQASNLIGGGGLLSGLTEHAELERARHRGRLAKLERGED